MADRGQRTTFNNHGPVQYQAGRDINPTVILSNPGFLDDLSLEELQQWASSKDLPDIQQLAARRLKDRLASLADADDWITQSCYTKEDLKVERLSGERLPLDQCYINLIGVPQAAKQIVRSQPSVLEPGTRLSDLSLWRRLNVEGPDGGTQIQLYDIFDAVQFRDTVPRSSERILIRGQAGAGKTTFCKKAVHDFVHSMVWKDHFDRILWVRLRNLRFRAGRYDLEEFFRDEFFSQHPKRDALAAALRDVCTNPSNGKTLFLLDGLDEIWHDLQSRIDLARFVTYLLNQPNVLVLSRPSVVLRSDIQPFDLELEMIGFNLDQVHQYVKRMEPMKYEAIKEFLESRPLLEDLVRIPVQLDALCYGWDQVQDRGPETMTDLYHAIEKGLWRKDIVQLGKRIDGTPVTEDDKLYDTELEKLIEAECCFVEGLAFTGICSNVAEFQERHLNIICRHFSRNGTFVDRTLRKLSYLRTSDSSVGKPSRTYHFLHLTLQEYFAARYFVRVWLQKGKLICLSFDENGTLQGNPLSQPTVKPRDFLAKHKYSWRHNIMWRFVVGLLHSGPAGSDEGTMQFLRAVHAKPLDLLGLTHQRLTMHCLMELNPSNLSERLKEHRSRLEDHLGKWAMYQAKREMYRRPTIAEEPEFPSRPHLMMLKQEDPDVCRAALTASKKWSQSRMPAEFVDALLCWFRRDQSQKLATAGPTSILDRGLTSILRPMFFMAGCAEDESLEEIAIKASGPPRYWTKDVTDAIIGCLSNPNHGVKMAVLSALKEDPEAVATHIEAISKCVDVEYSPLRQHAIDIISEQKHLPQNTLESIAIRLCRPKEERIVRDKILRILTDNSYWIHFLRARSTETQEQGGEPKQLIDIGLAIVKHQNLKTATTAVLALGYHDQDLNRTAMDQIVQCLSREEVVMRLASLDALARQKHLDLEDLHAISSCLEDPDHLVQLTAINALEGRSALADMEDALCSLVMCIKGANLDIQIAAKRLLRCQKSLSEAVFKTMVSCFEHESFHKLVFGYSPSTARRADGVMPPFDEGLLVSIISHLNDTSWKVRWGVLALFDGQPKLPEMVLHAVIECLVDEEESVRQLAVQVLEGHRSDFNQTLYTSLRTHLSHQSPQKRESVFHALWATADPPESLLDLIKEGLQDLDAGIRVAALEVWIERPNLSPKLHDAVAMYCESLPSSDRRGRRKFLDMLFRRPNARVMNERTLLAFAGFLNDEDKMIREHTLDFLTGHQNLPREVLSKISAFPDALIDSRGAIFSLLKHGEAYDTCLARTNVGHLFELLLSRSYVTHLAWYAQDGQTHVETGNGVAHAPLENPRAFASAVKKARKKMGAPDVVVKVPRRWLGVEW